MPSRPPVHRPSYARTAANRRDYDRWLGNSASRGYDHNWREFRLAVLADRPLCQDCEQHGRVTAAEEVHHVVKVRDDITRRLDRENVLALCKSCHSARTARGE